MTELKFEVRKRTRVQSNFWSVIYDAEHGTIKSIEPGKVDLPNSLQVSYPRVKNILAGTANQSDYKVDFNEQLGSLDLIDLKKPTSFKKLKAHKSWRSSAEHEGSPLSDLRVGLFADTGILRIEASRRWSTALKEKIMNGAIQDVFSLFITDEEDPHLLFCKVDVDLQKIVNTGYYEIRLWSLMDHALLSTILFGNQRIRVNCSPIVDSVFYCKMPQYFPFSGMTDDQSILSHIGKGRHISLFLKDGSVWAQSHYVQGSSIDQLVGNVSVMICCGSDPDNFVAWAELPALMLRQHYPFEILDKWPYPMPPSVLYKANNLDIGVLQ